MRGGDQRRRRFVRDLQPSALHGGPQTRCTGLRLSDRRSLTGRTSAPTVARGDSVPANRRWLVAIASTIRRPFWQNLLARWSRAYLAAHIGFRQRMTNTGILLWVRTLCVSLPRRIAA